MEELPTVPYFAPTDELPELLPSREAIAAADVCYADTESGRIVRVGQHYVVKYGSEVSLIEGQTILFVAAALPAVSVPKVYALYRSNDPSIGIPLLQPI